MSYEFYKVLHLTGIFMTLCGLAGVLGLRMATVDLPARGRKLFMITHGIGLVLALVGGFGLAARLQMFANLPVWVWAKIVIWLVLGGALTLVKRRGQIGAPLLVLMIGLAVTGAWLAVNKPF